MRSNLVPYIILSTNSNANNEEEIVLTDKDDVEENEKGIEKQCRTN